MNLFNYLMTKKGHNTSVRDDLFAYLLGKRTPEEVKTATGTTISITDATREKIVSLTLSKESTQDGEPTPDNPVEVKTVKGYRNLFDKTLTNIANNRLRTEILSTGIRVICNVRETSLQANNAARYITIDVTNYIGKKISLFCHAKSSSTNKGFFYLRLCKQNGDTDSSYGTQISAETLDGDLSVTYEIPSGIGEYHYLMIAIYGNRNSPCEINDYVDYTNLMLVEGENNYPYVPYGTNWIYTAISNGTDTNYYTIPLNNNEIAGIGDYKDELIVDKNGKCWLNKKTAKIDSYSGETITTNYMSTTGGLDTGATVYYVLDTPQLIDLNYTVDIELFEGVNNISNSEDMDMTLKYY